MRAPLIVIVLCSVSTAVCAQSANETVKGLESCFRLARGAGPICSVPSNDAVQRLNCFQKARRAQLECLESIPSETSAASVRPQMSAGTVRSELPIDTVSSEVFARAGSSERSSGSVSAGKTTQGPKKLTAVPSERTIAAVSPDVPARTANMPPSPQDPNWIVSETNSPVDYAPSVTATIRSPSNGKDAPKVLAIRCRGQRTELLVRTEGTWHPSGGGEVQVAYQINDQAFARRPWTASADGKAASYKDDAVGLLQSLPEGAQLKINVLDGPGPGHQATFQLAGWDVVRAKIAMACKWTPIANKMTSEQR